MLKKEEILFFKQKLEEQRVKIRANLNIESSEINLLGYDKPKDEGDHALLSMRYHIGGAVLKQQANRLIAIEKSLKKIKNDNYGICDLCEEPINIERLKVKVFAEYCIPCKELMEKK